jgi:CBS domain-containing protein
MKVRTIMSQPPHTCRTETVVRLASQRMQETGAGLLAVLDGSGRLAGVVTDRDIALAVGRHGEQVEKLPVGTLMNRDVHTCGPNESVRDALDRMASARVRRLPVVDRQGDIKGVVSIDDVILWAVGPHGVSMHDLIRALRSVVASRTAQPEPELPRF